jgi:hypothetical protein
VGAACNRLASALKSTFFDPICIILSNLLPKSILIFEFPITCWSGWTAGSATHQLFAMSTTLSAITTPTTR